MKKIINLIATRIFKYRGITQTMHIGKIIYIQCLNCGKEFKPTKENIDRYMFGHENCPNVYVKPIFKFERYEKN